jgi:integrase
LPRTKRDASLDSRAKRARLKARTAPYWTWISEGCSLGYRRNQRGGVWIARLYKPHGKPALHQYKIGPADDEMDADGKRLFDYQQALDEAKKWFAGQTDELNGSPRNAVYTVGDAMKDYLDEFERSGKRSLKGTTGTVNAHILPKLGSKLVEKLTRDDVRNWLTDLVQSPARRRSKKGGEQKFKPAPATEEERRRRQDTANRILTVLKAGLNFALHEGKVECSGTAWREVKPFRAVGAIRLRFLSVKEQQLFVSKCEGEFKLLVLGALHSGARLGELVRLRVMDFNGSALYVPAQISKTGKPRTINLDLEGQRFFRALTSDRPCQECIFLHDGRNWNKSEQHRPMKEACKAAGLAPFPFYVLRHSVASNWLRLGVPMKYIAEQLGNSLAICEKHYVHIAPDHRAEVFRSLPVLGLTSEPMTTLSSRSN